MAGSLILLTVFLLLFASTQPGEGILRRIIQGQLSSAMHQNARIGKLETNVLSRLRLEDISVPASDTAKTGVKIGSVELRYSLPPLLRRTIGIDSVHVESVDIDLVKGSAEGYNLELLDSLVSRREDAREPSGGGGGWRVETGMIRVEGADISYSDLSVPVTFRLNQISLRTGASPDGGRYIFARNGSGMVRFRDFATASVLLFSRAEVRDGRILSDSTSLSVDSLFLSAAGSVRISGEYRTDIDLKLNGRPSDLLNRMAKRFHPDLPAVTGPVTVEAEFNGPISSPEGNIRISAGKLDYRGLNFTDTRIAAGRYGDTLSVDTLVTEFAGGTVSAEGAVIAADSLKGSAALFLESLRLDKISGSLPENRKSIGGTVSGSVNVDLDGASWRGWRAEAGLTVETLSYESSRAQKLELLAGYADKRLSMDLRHEGADLKGSVSLGDSALEGSFRADIERLELLSVFPGLGEISGSGHFQADIEGLYGNPSVRAGMRLKDVSARGIEIDTLSFQGSLRKNRVKLDSLCIYQDKLLIKAAGDFDRETSEAVFSAGLFSGSPASFSRDSAVVPERLLDLCSRPLSYNPEGYLNAEFSLPEDSPFHFRGSGRGVELGSVFQAISDSTEVAGTAGFDLTVRGPLDSLTADLNLEVTDPVYREVRFDSLLITGSFDRGDLKVNRINLSRAGQLVRGSLNMILEKDSSMYWKPTPGSATSGEIETENFDLGVLNTVLPKGKKVEGMVWVNLKWDGTIYHPNPAGSLRVESASFAAEGKEATPVTDIYIDMAVSDSLLTLRRARAMAGGMPVSVKGKAVISPEDRLDIDLTAGIAGVRALHAKGVLSGDELNMDLWIDSLDLAVLEPMAGQLERIEGIVSGRVHLNGPRANPEITGTVTARGVELLPSVLDRPLTGGFLTAEFDGSRIRIDTLSAGLGEGSIELSGSAAVDTSGISDISMFIAGERLGFIMNENLEVHIDSLSLGWEPDGEYYRLKGSMDPGMIKYSRDIQPASLMPFSRDVREVDTEMPELFARTRLEINISGADSIWIDNNLARLRVSPDISISGFISQPNLSGRLAVKEGYIIYLDRKFKFEEGVAIFADPGRINPDINFRAASEVTTYQRTESIDYIITFKVTGTAEDPTVELSSQPPLPRPDILSILTLGATRAQLAGETGEVLRQRGEVLASNRISSYAGGKLGQALGLDRVTVTGNIFEPEGRSSPELIVTEEFAEGVTVTYRTRVGHLNEQRVELNWDLSKHWTVGGTTTRSGSSSISLTYSMRFR